MSSPQPTSRQKAIKYSSLVVLVLQNTSLVLFMRFAMTGNRPKFIKAITVFYGEVFKCIASIALVIIGHRSIVKGVSELFHEFVHKKKDFAKVLVPAVIYTIQNYLLYVAVDNLPAATFMVTYQLKILTTALFTVVVLKRKLSAQQWIALFFLFAGVAIVQYDQKMSDDREKAEKLLHKNATFTPATHNPNELENAFTHLLEKENSTLLPAVSTSTLAITSTSAAHRKEENSILGFSAVLVACVLSGFAGIYFEKILKGSKVSVWVRNVQLAAPSIIFALLFAFTTQRSKIFQDGFSPSAVLSNMMHGFDWAVWVTVAISAFGGLVVAVVIKFADNILKAFATSFAIVLNCILAYFLFSFRPTMFFVIGASLVIGAVIVYSVYPYRAKHHPVPTSDETEKNEEMKELGEKTEEKSQV